MFYKGKKYLTVTQVARELERSREFVYKAIRDGHLKTVEIFGKEYIAESEIKIETTRS